jgi:hypothetical protein
MFEKKDFGNDAVVQCIDSATHTADANGAAVDLLEYDGCLVIANVGESGDTLSGSVLVDLEIETSDDNSTWVDAADAVITNSVTGTTTGTFGRIDAAAEDDASYTTAYLGRERYIRPVINVTGTHSNGIPIGIVAVRSRGRYT